MKEQEAITDLNHLYRSYRNCKKGVSWKPQVQRFEHDYFLRLCKMKYQLETGTYQCRKGTEFSISERGKKRSIHTVPFYDRVIRRDTTDYVLYPNIKRYLIHDNGGSQKGKGISFTQRRFEQHIHEAYREYGTNDIYVLLIDFKKFYDNIQHEILLNILEKYVHEDFTKDLLKKIVKNFEVDVSYMSDEQYKNCYNDIFDSNWYAENIPKSLQTKEKFMAKSCWLGDPCSLIFGLIMPSSIDNYCKIVKGIRYYDRFADDTAIISSSKSFLKSLLKDIREIAKSLGITINEKKTQIKKFSKGVTWLHTKYRLTKSGHLIKEIGKEKAPRERRRLKKQKKLLAEGKMTFDQIHNSFRSAMGSTFKHASKETKDNLYGLFTDLFGLYLMEGE